MALKKEVQTSFGILADYWRVDNLRYSKKEGKLSCYLGLNATKDALQPLAGESFEFTLSSEEAQGNLLALCYTKIKAEVEFFKTAEDA